MKERIDRVLFKRAQKALKNAFPMVSNFHVGAAGLAVGRNGKSRIVLGWNNEFRHADSIHAEESLVAKLREGELLTRIVVLGQNKSLLAPCGNCGEVLISRSSEGAQLLIKKESGESAWVPVKDILPNVYDEVKDVNSLPPGNEGLALLALFNKARAIMNDRPYNPYTGKLRAAVILTEEGTTFAASGKEDAAYHHDHAVEIALGIADANRKRKVSALLFMHGGEDAKEPLFPCGRCRQKLYEASQVGSNDFKVISAMTSGRLWFTTVSKLFPFAFGPKDLGIDVSRYL